MKILAILVGALLLMLFKPAVLLLICVVIVLATTFLRWSPEFDQRHERQVRRIRSRDHRRWRITNYPIFLTLPRLPR